MALYSFDPKKLSVIVGPYVIKGFSESMLTITKTSDAFSMVVGADGEATRVKSNDGSATITLTLQQGSPSNDQLSLIATADELSNSGVFPLLIKDNLGNTVAAAGTCFISKLPDVTFGKTQNDRSWNIMTDNLIMFVGGSASTTANYNP
jgi:hypothetical protein